MPVKGTIFDIQKYAIHDGPGIRTTVDTSGYAPPQVFATILAAANRFLDDLKVINPSCHRELTGVSNRPIWFEPISSLTGTTSSLMSWMRKP